MGQPMTPSEIADWLSDRSKHVKCAMQWEYEQAAATIRKQAEQIKIATEALERLAKMNEESKSAAQLAAQRGDDWGMGYYHAIHDTSLDGTQALARIKEVG